LKCGTVSLRRGLVREGLVRLSARADSKEIAIDFSGCSPRACAGPLRARVEQRDRD
jgi:hypothetical protein